VERVDGGNAEAEIRASGSASGSFPAFGQGDQAEQLFVSLRNNRVICRNGILDTEV